MTKEEILSINGKELFSRTIALIKSEKIDWLQAKAIFKAWLENKGYRLTEMGWRKDGELVEEIDKIFGIDKEENVK